MRLLKIFVPAVILAACQATPVPFEGTAYGEPLTLTETTQVAAILDSPEAYLGQRVMVEGVVAEVCSNMGCWMDILAEDGETRLQVKVDDGVIVFPQEAMGRRARVEGVVEKLELTEEEAVEAARHRAEEQGETFDPATVTGPVTTYRVRGAGAVIAE